MALEIRDTHIGAGRPKTIVSLMARDSAELVSCARRALGAGAELLEWRADFMAAPTGPKALAQASEDLRAAAEDVPLVFTFRTKGQGGQRELDGDAYQDLVSQAMGWKTLDLVDIELGAGDEAVRDLTAQAQAQGVTAIVSYHDFEGTPPTEEMCDLLWHMVELGAHIPKLAVMAHGLDDSLRLMEATNRVDQATDVPLLTLAMGKAGALTRLAGEAFGSCLTFCAVGKPSAPGQVGLTQALGALEALHAALSAGKTA